MRSEATFQMVAIAKRIADKNGVSVSDVLDKFSKSVKKTVHTRSDFFGVVVIYHSAVIKIFAAFVSRSCRCVAARLRDLARG